MRRVKIAFTIPTAEFKEGEVVQTGEKTITHYGHFHRWVHTLSYEPTPRPIVQALIEKDDGRVDTYDLEYIKFLEKPNAKNSTTEGADNS